MDFRSDNFFSGVNMSSKIDTLLNGKRVDFFIFGSKKKSSYTDELEARKGNAGTRKIFIKDGNSQMERFRDKFKDHMYLNQPIYHDSPAGYV